MSLQDFFNNVRIGQRLLESPRAAIDSTEPIPGALAATIEQADLWLTPRTVAGYNPEDFFFLKDDERSELDKAVQSFLRVARSAPPNRPVPMTQHNESRRCLESILRILAPDRFRTPQEWIASQAINQFRESPPASDYLTGAYYRFDEDEGDSTIWIWLVLRDEIVNSPEFLTRAKELRGLLDRWFHYYGVESSTVIGFRSATEQRQLEAIPVS